jgi:hypothetical protein
VNATITPLPGLTRLVAVPRRPTDVRKLLLAWLASEHLEGREVPEAITADLLTLYADPALSAERTTEAWADYRLAVTEEDETEDGPVAWADLTDGRREATETITRQNAACALADLAGRDINGGTA